MKKNKVFIISFLAPAVIFFIVLFIYPLVRTILMSFFQVKTMTDEMSQWKFYELNNFAFLWKSYIFKKSLINLLKIWIIGGAVTIGFAILFAVIITSGIRFKAFWRSIIYLPNIISAVALATMWVQYVFNSNFGLLKTFFTALHLNGLANIQWTSAKYLFFSMLISFCFGSIGYFMLILIAGIQRIPADYYEVALLEGANIFEKFFYITLPLIRDVCRTCIVLWSTTTINFFVWAQMFSPFGDPATMVPVYYMYNMLFGGAQTGSASNTNVGVGAAVGVILTVMIMVVYKIINLLIPERKLEY